MTFGVPTHARSTLKDLRAVFQSKLAWGSRHEGASGNESIFKGGMECNAEAMPGFPDVVTRLQGVRA